MKLRDTAERRPVTILHCDLVNSTQLVDRLDPEEFLGVVEQFLEMAAQVVEDFHGTVAGFTGDGIEAYFGYPVTTETPAVDAVAAALRIRNTLTANRLNTSVQLQCRVGVATGIAVVGKPESGELGRRLMAFGSVAHLAERLQSAAEPDQVFIDSETRKLSAQHFTFIDVGLAQLKGFEEDIELSEVAGLADSASRFDFNAHQSVPIAGRQYVIDVLNDRWQIVLQGEGQVVHLIGDAGIGKSRAMHEFQIAITHENVRTFHLQCSSQHVSTPLHPWIHYIPVLANFRQSDNVEQRLEKTQDYLTNRLELPDRLVELSLSLMGIDEELEAAAGVVPPIAALSELYRILADRIVEQSRKDPVIILVEDVQWIDATSSSWLELMIELASNESIFIGVTSRPGTPDFSANSHLTSLSVVKLSNSEASKLVQQLVERASGNLSDESIREIVRRSDGNPLYIEELTSMFLEQPVNAENGSSVDMRTKLPITLQMSLLARVDRIKRGRELAQIASVIGDSFTVEQMENLTERDRDSVSIGLSELVSSNVLRCIQRADIVRYEFRHSLLQDAVYSSLLNTKREQVHGKIASYLQARAETDGRYEPEVIAFHFESAKDWSGAFYYWVFAGERALRSGATSEAIDRLERAHLLVDHAGQDSGHLSHLQRMHMAYGMAVNAVRGAVANPGAHFKLASELGEQLDNIELTVEALDWQFGVAFNSGQLELCTEPAEQLIRIGQRTDNPLPFMAGSQALGMVYFNQGKFVEAVERFEMLFEREPDLVSGQHCYPSLSLSYFAWAKCMLGDRKSAFALAERAITSSVDESPHAYTIALSNCSYVYHALGDTESLERCNRTLNEHCEATGEFMYSRRAATMRDYLLTKRTKESAYLPSMVENLTALLEAKEEIELTYLFALLADAQIELGLYSGANESLLTAMAIANRNGEMFWFAQLNKMMAVVIEHEPQQCYKGLGPDYYLDRAIEVAAQQGALEWEEEAREHRMSFNLGDKDSENVEGASSGVH